MSISKFNQMRLYRKQTALTQRDIVYLLGDSDRSHLCLCENGNRIPKLEFLLAYEILFDVPISKLLEGHKEVVLQTLLLRMPQLMEELETIPKPTNKEKRIGFLRKTFTRLTS